MSFKGSLMKESFKRKFNKGLVETWYKLDDEEDSDREFGEANLALMALTHSDSEFESGSGFESDEEDEVCSKPIFFNPIHNFMIHFQDKARHMNDVKKQFDFL